jgi:glycosyltransferase involved in cell wall biosynthesis/predicted metal-dependent phosphoesterase TrpH
MGISSASAETQDPFVGTAQDPQDRSTQSREGVTDSQASGSTVRVDMHCHSSASEISRLGVQRAVGLPECATPPEEVYELAKRRGMDFVTITDHDTIDGVLQIADRPDVFVSEELTASFRGEPQAVHVLCYGITPDDHEWLQAHSDNVEQCAIYMHEREIACALAHPYYHVGAPLTPRHRRRLAEMFRVWEVRNGARARQLNVPAATYIAALDGAGIGGSDDHAGVDVGRTWTEMPHAAATKELLTRVRAGNVAPGGSHGGAAKWAHAAIALAARSLGGGDHGTQRPDPRAVLTMAARVLREGDARHGSGGGDLTPADARALLRAWLAAVELDHLDERGLIAHMQQDGFSHSALYRRAAGAHERKLRAAVDQAVAAILGQGSVESAALGIFEGCVAAIPYAPAKAFLAREQAKIDAERGEGEQPRVAIIADGIGATHGVSRTIEEIRRRGVPGYEIEVVGTDPAVDRRLAAVAEVEVPFYPGLTIGVPSLTSAVQALTEGGFDAIHVCSPGPAGVAGVLLARALGLPLIGSYHTELTAYAELRSGRQAIAAAMAGAVGAFYSACDVVLSPSSASDQALLEIGIPQGRVMRWDRGVDTSRFSPSLRTKLSRHVLLDSEQMAGVPLVLEGEQAAGAPHALEGEQTTGTDGSHADDNSHPARERIDVLYAGRITREKGADLLADAFLAARERDPRLQLLLAGGGPEQEMLQERLGEHASFLGWLKGTELATAYANADVFLFPSATDTFGQVILEAQASGLPVVAVAQGGPLTLIEHRVSGLLCDAQPQALADAVIELAGSPLLRRRIAAAGLARVRERTWEAAMERLADGYEHVLKGFAEVEEDGAQAA